MGATKVTVESTGDEERAGLYAKAARLQRELDDPARLRAIEEVLRELSETLVALREPRRTRGGGLESTAEPRELPPPPEQGVVVEVAQGMRELPSGVAHLLEEEEHPAVRVRLRNAAGEARRLRVRCALDGWAWPSERTLLLPPGAQRELSLLPRLRPERARGLREVARAALSVRVDRLDDPAVAARPLWHETLPVWLLASTTAPIGYNDASGGRFVDLTHLLGAWVTPNAEPVQRLLREAAALHPARRLVGYQARGDEVDAQARAIYEAVRATSILYVNSVLTPGVAAGTLEQRVRRPAESIRCRSANCLDGVVLLASLLEAASLRAAIVLTAGHAFLAWDRTPERGEWAFLEGTMVSAAPFDDAQKEGELRARVLKMIHPNHAALDDPYRLAIRPVDGMRRRRVFAME